MGDFDRLAMKYLKFFMIFILLCLLAVGIAYVIKYGAFLPKVTQKRVTEVQEGELSSAEAYLNHGAEDYQNSQYEHAILDFSKAIEINPRLPETYNNLGIAYGKGKGLHDQAIIYFSEAIEINPVYAEAYANRGVAYGNKGIYDKAISDFNKAIELNPEYPDVYFNKAQLCEKTGRIREAVETYKEFIRYAPPQYSRIIEHAKQRIIKLEGR